MLQEVAFRFRFENILTYKENIETQKSIEFSQAQNTYRRQKEKVDLLIAERDNLINLMREVSSSSEFDFNLFNVIRSFVLKLEEDIKFEQDILSNLKEIMEAKRKELVKASQDKKIMEKLKEKEFKLYEDMERKKETIELDEINLKYYNKKLQNNR
ncbi:MAG TPA: flagellar export protein FliJ [Candidatus Atribacteria bacterium]|nr:flagellar export protein FliJ [Candidatus Atribacteria bacterium]